MIKDKNDEWTFGPPDEEACQKMVNSLVSCSIGPAEATALFQVFK